MTHYQTLVLSGGSTKCIAMLGSIQYGYDNNLLQKIDTFIGTSAGGIICYLLCIGYTPIEIIMYVCRQNIFKRTPPIDIVSMINGTGALEFSTIGVQLEKMTIEKVGRLLTFQDIKSIFDKRLVLNTYNLSEDKIEYLSPETTPNLPCLAGLRQTCSLPFIFEPYKYMGSFYIDGGIYENFAISFEVQNDTNRRLGICVEVEEAKRDPTNSSMMEYIFHLLAIPIRQNIQHILQKHKDTKNNIDIINIKANISLLQFQLSSHELLELFSTGYQQMKAFFNPTEPVSK